MSTQYWQSYSFPIQFELFLFQKEDDVCLKLIWTFMLWNSELSRIFCEIALTPPAWLGARVGVGGRCPCPSFTVEGEDLWFWRVWLPQLPTPTLAEPAQEGEQGLLLLYESPGSHVISGWHSWRGSLRRNSYPHPTICITTLSWREAEIQALHLAFVDGGRVGASALPVVLLSSHIIIVWKFAVLLGCLVPWPAAWEYRPSFLFHVHWCFWVPTSPAPDPGYKKRKENPGKTSPCPSLAPRVSS